MANKNCTERKNKTNERNEKFLDFYNEIKDSEEFTKIKTHKRVKYLSEQFANKTQLHMPIGTIYKLLRSEHIETPDSGRTLVVSPVSEQANLETVSENQYDSTTVSDE